MPTSAYLAVPAIPTLPLLLLISCLHAPLAASSLATPLTTRRAATLSSHPNIISRHVVFDEDVFPLAGSSPPPDLDSLLEFDPSPPPSQVPRLAPLPAPRAASPPSRTAPSTPPAPRAATSTPPAPHTTSETPAPSNSASTAGRRSRSSPRPPRRSTWPDRVALLVEGDERSFFPETGLPEAGLTSRCSGRGFGVGCDAPGTDHE